MRLIPSIEDQMRDVQTWELPDGRRVRIDAMAAREHGAAYLLHRAGLLPDVENMPRKPVYQYGEMVGTVPGFFVPEDVRSLSPMYDPRRGDFVEHKDGFLAAPSLGPGDLEAVIGFRPA